VLTVYTALLPAATLWLAGVAPTVKSGGPVTISVRFAVWLRLPLVAVTVNGYVPGVVLPVVVRVNVELPLPVTVVGLKSAVTPEGSPLIVNPTLPANPLTAVVLTVYTALLPATALWLPGVAPTVKSGGPLTISVRFAVWLKLPLVVVTTSGYVPGAAPPAVVSVNVELPLPVTVVGLKSAVTPEGSRSS
jgi:hypothetical protein